MLPGEYLLNELAFSFGRNPQSRSVKRDLGSGFSLYLYFFKEKK